MEGISIRPYFNEKIGQIQYELELPCGTTILSNYEIGILKSSICFAQSQAKDIENKMIKGKQ